MSTLKFAETYNLVAFLEKSEQSNGFVEIIDFLNAISVQYALTVNPTIYTTCIEQFWISAKVKTVNGERQIQALVDKKKVIISETSIRSDLKLDDAEGTYCLPTAIIFEELERMEYENLTQKLKFFKAYFSSQWKFLIHTILQCLSAKTTSWNDLVALWHLLSYDFSRRVTPLLSTMMVQYTEDMVAGSATPTDSHSTTIITQPSSLKPQNKKSRRKQRKDSAPTEPTTEETTPEEHEKVLDLEKAKTAQAKEITSLKKRVKQLEKRRKSRTSGLRRGMHPKKKERLKDLNADAKVTLVNETEKMNDDNLMFNTGVLEEQEIEFEKVVKEPVVSVATTTKSIPVSTVEVVTTASAKMARNLEAQLQAELIEEGRLARQREEEANIALIESWDNTQAMMEADFELAQRLQAEE
ncbi:hypothetical protein Tco_0952780 [Tanacetum coccineum]|uniref:Uncharacterized protein n=1 Tax=Tanacetum coccineum TaxID=301880 RepID=A0ABQ5DYB1_9ASTR